MMSHLSDFSGANEGCTIRTIWCFKFQQWRTFWSLARIESVILAAKAHHSHENDFSDCRDDRGIEHAACRSVVEPTNTRYSAYTRRQAQPFCSCATCG